MAGARDAALIYLEASVWMLPAEGGGRSGPVWPREGSYRPFVRGEALGEQVRLRVIEGPPRLEPGTAGLIVAEVESEIDDLTPGTELDLVEPDDRLVGILTVLRTLRSAIVA